MIEINKTTIGIAAGVIGTLFVGYCIYFDHKRRKDPEYKKKIRERRSCKNNTSTTAKTRGMPNLNDLDAIERYFLQEIESGETHIANGDFESGVEHLANALIVCGQPSRLLQILETSLPPQVFAMLILKMHEFRGAGGGDSRGGGDGLRITTASATVESISSDSVPQVAGVQ